MQIKDGSLSRTQEDRRHLPWELVSCLLYLGAITKSPDGLQPIYAEAMPGAAQTWCLPCSLCNPFSDHGALAFEETELP